jgi:hypothetical protein
MRHVSLFGAILIVFAVIVKAEVYSAGVFRIVASPTIRALRRLARALRVPLSLVLAIAEKA